MGNTFNITSLLQSVDQIGQNYVQSAYQALSNAADVRRRDEAPPGSC